MFSKRTRLPHHLSTEHTTSHRQTNSLSLPSFVNLWVTPFILITRRFFENHSTPYWKEQTESPSRNYSNKCPFEPWLKRCIRVRKQAILVWHSLFIPTSRLLSVDILIY